jgi:DNA polymerase-1
VNGKVYGQFHQLRAESSEGDRTGARSGRFSSSTPNLQNIPFRSELGKLVRKSFVPDPGHRRWIKNDYNQIEYRGLAHYAVGPKSDEVRELYRTNPKTDFHKMAHGLILAATGQDLERPDVKNMNFGVAYGMGEAAMARRLGVVMQKAKALMQAFHDGAPFLKETMNACILEAQRLGYITTILGRRSRFDLWEPSNWEERKTKRPLPYHLAVTQYPNPQRAYLHKALNRRLQGSAADLIKMAMLMCWKSGVFDYTGVPRLTVHDELDFSDPGGKEDGFREIIHIMQTAIPFRVPILVESETGPNWGDVKKVT